MEDENALTLESLSARVARQEWITLSIGLSVLAFFSLIALSIQMAVPKFEQIFSAMLNDVPLPRLTHLIMSSSRSGLAQIIAGLLPLGVAILVIVKRRSFFPWVILLAMIFILMLQIVATALGLYLPYITITTMMGGI